MSVQSNRAVRKANPSSCPADRSPDDRHHSSRITKQQPPRMLTSMRKAAVTLLRKWKQSLKAQHFRQDPSKCHNAIASDISSASTESCDLSSASTESCDLSSASTGSSQSPANAANCFVGVVMHAHAGYAVGPQADPFLDSFSETVSPTLHLLVFVCFLCVK